MNSQDMLLLKFAWVEVSATGLVAIGAVVVLAALLAGFQLIRRRR